MYSKARVLPMSWERLLRYEYDKIWLDVSERTCIEAFRAAIEGASSLSYDLTLGLH